MCAEAVRWRCHRRIVADYAIASGRRVFSHLHHKRSQTRDTHTVREAQSAKEMMRYPTP
jgi:uncharacterized protein (DUF488 family)